MELFWLLAMFMVPAAIIWVVAYLVVRRSRIKRIALFVAFYLAIGFWTGMLTVIFAHVWLPVTLATLGMFEWALTRKPQ